MIYPIGISFPEELMVKEIKKKTQVMSTVIPGVLDTYVFTDQDSYYEDYQKSMFALTFKKAGWDCFRHYEILANGCVPLFPKLEACPSLTMHSFPKQLILEANKNPDRYTEYATRLLDYTRQHLTTEATANYLLSVCGKSNATNVLFLSESTAYGVNYLRCMTLHGLKSILGSGCHDFPRVNHLYKDYTGDSTSLWGRGFGTTKLLNIESRDSSRDSTIEEDIRSKRYDLIVYGHIHFTTPYWDLVNAHYDPSQIAMLCNVDIHDECPLYGHVSKGYKCFMREIPV